MIRHPNVTQLKKYCKENNIKNYSKYTKGKLINHIIKSLYFNALKKYNSSDEELFQVMRYKLEERREIFEECETVAEPLTKTTDKTLLIFNIKETIETIKKSKQKPINEESRVKLLTNRVHLQKLKEEYEKLTGTKWSKTELIDYSPRPDSMDGFVSDIKMKYAPDNIEFVEVNIERYDNLYEDFKRYHYQKYKDIDRLNNEKILFHGTDEKHIESILDNDFALINHRRHGSAYGNGIYFTDKLEKACSYSTDPKYKYVIVCNVHIGNVILGTQSLNMLSHFIDTSVDNMKITNQYIKKKNHQYTFLGVLKIETSPQSKLNVEIVLNRGRNKCTLVVNNKTFDKNIEILFVRNPHAFPLTLSPNDLFIKISDHYKKGFTAKNVSLNFQKLLPAKVKSFTNITTTMNSIYIIGYYEGQDLHIMNIGRIDNSTNVLDY